MVRTYLNVALITVLCTLPTFVQAALQTESVKFTLKNTTEKPFKYSFCLPSAKGGKQHILTPMVLPPHKTEVLEIPIIDKKLMIWQEDIGKKTVFLTPEQIRLLNGKTIEVIETDEGPTAQGLITMGLMPEQKGQASELKKCQDRIKELESELATAKDRIKILEEEIGIEQQEEEED